MRAVIGEIARKRDLIRELVVKDLKVRYAKPAFGFFWSFISPLLTVLVFYFVFSILLRVRIEEAPFFLYLMSAVFSWKFFSESVFCSLTSLVDNRNLVRESGIPQYFLPLSVVLSQAVIFLPCLCILLAASFFTMKGLPAFAALLPAVLVIHFFFTLGVSLVCSIMFVRWRETRYIAEFLLQALFYLTPAFYSLSMVRHLLSPVLFSAYLGNPFVSILGLYRMTLLRGFYFYRDSGIGLFELLVLTSLWAFLFLALGFLLFKVSKSRLNERLSY